MGRNLCVTRRWPDAAEAGSAGNTSSEIFADSAYRSQRNEKWLASKMLVNRIYRRKPAGKRMPQNIARANAAKASIRAAVEQVFAHQKNRLGLFIRTIGIARAKAGLNFALIAYNLDRLVASSRLSSFSCLLASCGRSSRINSSAFLYTARASKAEAMDLRSNIMNGSVASPPQEMRY